MNRRLRSALAGAAAVAGLVSTLAPRPAPRLLWNASASAPEGLYRILPGGSGRRGDMVVARVPAAWRDLAAKRHYLPANVPLVKHVGAASEDEVCALNAMIFINGRPAAERRRFDPSGRALAWWEGCVRLTRGQVFLLTARPDSFDGRYFGVSAGGDVVGRAVLLWRR